MHEFISNIINQTMGEYGISFIRTKNDKHQIIKIWTTNKRNKIIMFEMLREIKNQLGPRFIIKWKCEECNENDLQYKIMVLKNGSN